MFKCLNRYYRRKLDTGYYKLGMSLIVDCSKKTVYRIETNVFYDYEKTFIKNDGLRYEEKISQPEYLKLYKNTVCNCELGQKRNLQYGRYYNLKKIFEEMYPNRLDISVEIDKTEKGYYTFTKKGYYYRDRVIKQACMNCKTCTSQGRMIQLFECVIEQIDDNDLIEKICK